MEKELYIRSIGKQIEIALIEDKKLVELHYDNSGGHYNVGDFYLGTVKKVAKGLNAAFVDVGFEKDAFLHYTDLSPQFNNVMKFTEQASSMQNFDYKKFELVEDIQKAGKITDVLQPKKKILVQILKEPISSKGPRISCELSLPGRFIVLLPFTNVVNVSKKIHSREERARLKSIITNIQVPNIGVIVRTAAEGKSSAELHKDFMEIMESWKALQQKLYNAKAPNRILNEQDKTTSLLRDLLSDDFNQIITDDNDVLRETKNYLAKIAPGKENMVAMHKNGAALFDHFGISKQMKSSFGKTVMLENGGYLVIEHTEALHVIDVNSGHKFSAEDQENTALQTNTIAAKEIARQLRLRDIGGIIIVDFIDMRDPENRKTISKAMNDAMKSDRTRHTVLPISKFGLLQITRQRLRPEISISTSEKCPSCEGTGKIRSSMILIEDIEKHVKYLTQNMPGRLELRAHPIVISHLTKGFFSNIFKKWKKSYGKFLLSADDNLGIAEYKFFDQSTSEEVKF